MATTESTPRRGTYHVVGHRGAKDLSPENTIESFLLAEEIGVHELEFDVRLSSDGVPIVVHDATLDRTAADPSGHGLGPVAELPYERIRAVDVGEGRHVPTLTEVLDATNVFLQVEIKAVEACEAIAAVVEDRPEDASRIRFTSFSPEALRRMLTLAPHISRGLITHGCPDAERHPTGIEQVLADIDADAFYCGWNGLTDDLVTRIQDSGYEMGGWPVRTFEELRRGLVLGFGGGTVDDPRAAMDWLSRARAELAL
ncbi:glycerophosphodiester phosphodiesterase [Rhodococcus sp. B50]|uniref:glycerophosphodiester phosphodiesterase n=1 Tax=Rhodococcus sp. B50 TaxID=2682847 RepID=UPI001BD68665|nr:glycerophosphodiester phosphodiesterase family protein [Rhodococcus sp. B50]MBS9371817.1 Glycerophosphodiester phosphodiesterase, cytoplasmic [Rhodococcus sp. B50]